MKKVLFLVGVVILVLSLLAPLSASAAPPYSVVPLGFVPTALNNQGIVGGNALVSLGGGEWRSEAVIWRNGQLTNLGVFGGQASGVMSLNDEGLILVSVTPSGIALDEHFLVNSDGIVRTKVELPYGGIPRKLNNLSQIVGYVAEPGEPIKGLVWNQGYKVLVETKSYCTFENINNLGQAIGYGSLSGFYSTPILWSNSAVWPLETQVGTGTVSAINDQGQIVGSYDTDPTHSTPNAYRPALWKDCQLFKLKDLGLPGLATDINERGETIGYLGSEWVIWSSPEAKPLLLNKMILRSSIKVKNVFGLNDAGQIICEGERRNGTRGYFFLQPRYLRR